MASLKASDDNPRLSSDNILYNPKTVAFREDVMFNNGEDEMFASALFLSYVRAADENVAGKIKLTEINSKHLAISGIFFFRLIGTTDQAAKISLKPKAESLKLP